MADKLAPKVISMVGTMQNLVNEVLQAVVGNYFRDTLQGMAAVQFIENRAAVRRRRRRTSPNRSASTTSRRVASMYPTS